MVHGFKFSLRFIFCRLILIRLKPLGLIRELKRVVSVFKSASPQPTRISSPQRDEAGSSFLVHRVWLFFSCACSFNLFKMWLILAVILALPLLVFAYFELSVARRRRMLNKVKGPPTMPILGNAYNVGKTPAGKKRITLANCLFSNCIIADGDWAIHQLKCHSG